MTAPPTGGHADDLLSAHIDDELDASTDEWVVGHLSRCEECRSAAAALREVRSAVRSLPEVDAGPVVEGFLARHRRLIRTGAAFVGLATVVLGTLALTAAVDNPSVVPDVESMAAVHRDAAHAEMAGVRVVQRPGGSYAAPAALIGSSVQLSRHAVFDGRDLTVILYRGDDVDVSIFEQPGTLEWDALPSGEVRSVAGRRVWLRDGRTTVVVAELGHVVATVVSEDRGAALTAVAGLPQRHRGSRWDRLHDACQRFTRVFTLGA